MIIEERTEKAIILFQVTEEAREKIAEDIFKIPYVYKLEFVENE